MVGLAKNCHGPDAKGRDRAVITRIREGEHPDRRRGGSIGPPWPVGRAHAGSEAAFEELAGRKSLGLAGLLGKANARGVVEEAMEAQTAMEDSWPEGQAYPDGFGLEDLVQFFGAEGMGLG